MVRQTEGMRVRSLVSLLLVLAAGAIAGCGDGDDATPAASATTTAAAAAPKRPVTPALCRKLDDAVTGRVQDRALNELSGLVQSRADPGLLWSHEDSGAGPQLWALTPDGRVLGGVTVTGAQAVDWEDIATGPAPSGEGNVLYVADIGDNRAQRDSVTVYRIPEPSPGAGASAPAEQMVLRYPDGPRDAETLLVDPRRGTLVIVSKEISGGRAYSVPRFTPGEATLRRGPEVAPVFATGGDVSADGRVVAVRGYTSLAVWRRRGGESIVATLRRAPCTPPTSHFEGQGEALALNRTGTAARTVAEGSPAVLRRYVPAR